jgi:hypothetical protein
VTEFAVLTVEVEPHATTAPNPGDLLRGDANGADRYAFVIRGNGAWVVGKALIPPGGTSAKQSGLARGSVNIRAHQTLHLRFECSGPEQPGSTGKVTLKFLINGKRVATVTDATSPLPVALPAAVAMEVDGMGAASFSNIAVAQL